MTTDLAPTREPAGVRATLPSLTRQLALPQGFTLSTTGVFAILLERHPHPGPVAIWLFVVGAVASYMIVVGTSHAHRSSAPVPTARGYQLFNLAPIPVVPLASLVHWWIQPAALAYALAGLAVGCSYLLAVFVLFRAVQRRSG